MGSAKWWKQKPGRWDPKLEDALACEDPGRVGLAWAVILALGGRRGDQKRLAELAGVEYKTLNAQLAGRAAATVRVQELVARAANLPVNLVQWPHHPFAVQAGPFQVIEPGDPEWRTVWEAIRAFHPDRPSAEELNLAYPTLFP